MKFEKLPELPIIQETAANTLDQWVGRWFVPEESNYEEIIQLLLKKSMEMRQCQEYFPKAPTYLVEEVK